MNIDSGFEVLSKLSNIQKEKFGKVYLVQKDTVKYILKILPKNSSPLAISLLQNESQFSFDNSNLQSSIDYWENEHGYYLQKNYLEGITIDLHIKSLKKSQKKQFLADLATNLSILLNEIHQKGYVHADLKPSNILIDSKGEVKIIDFGLAIEKGKEILPRPTLFSLGYAAPEIVLNQWSLVDETADYFSVGVLFHKLITGDLPWKHSNPSIMTNLQITYPLPAHSKLNKTLHKLLADLTFKYQFKTSPAKMTLTDLQAALKIGIAQREKSLIPLINYLKQQNQKTSIWAWFKS